jgi:hypothetical protein
MEALVSAGVDLCQYPAQTPPDGQISNFVDPVSLQSAVIGVGVSIYYFHDGKNSRQLAKSARSRL